MTDSQTFADGIKRRIKFLEKSPQISNPWTYNGEIYTPNCHGTTLFLIDRLDFIKTKFLKRQLQGTCIDSDCKGRAYVNPLAMENILAKKTVRTQAPEFGDIVSLWSLRQTLQHTGIYIEPGLIFNQMDQGGNYQYISTEDYLSLVRQKYPSFSLAPLYWRFHRLK